MLLRWLVLVVWWLRLLRSLLLLLAPPSMLALWLTGEVADRATEPLEASFLSQDHGHVLEQDGTSARESPTPLPFSAWAFLFLALPPSSHS